MQERPPSRGWEGVVYVGLRGEDLNLRPSGYESAAHVPISIDPREIVPDPGRGDIPRDLGENAGNRSMGQNSVPKLKRWQREAADAALRMYLTCAAQAFADELAN
jgi:hypothetical protein